MQKNVESTAPTKKTYDWVTIIFIGAYHIGLFIGLPIYLLNATPGWGVIGWSVFLFFATTMSITAGYHRYYSHRTYNLKRPVEWVLLFFGTMATQGSVWRWTFDHRLHHTFVDKDRDPYAAPKGFWHSHILWMFTKGEPLDDKFLGDLKGDKLLEFQDKYYGLLVTITNLVAVIAVGFLTGDFIGAFVIAFLLRLFLTHHCTWFINSLAHMWGSKPYSTEHTAVNNFILAFLTSGEGYHNYHHTFASDYRNGVRWYQYDPTKYLIWVLSKLGLASGLKRTDTLMIKKKLVQADHKLLTEHLAEIGHVDMQKFKAEVNALSDKIIESLASAKNLGERWRKLDRKQDRTEWEELKSRYKEMKKEIQQDLKIWGELCSNILKLKPAV